MRVSKLSFFQLRAIQCVYDGEVRVRWGMTVEADSPVSNNTLWSLEDRGLVTGPRNEVGKVKLTAFGKQICDLIGDGEQGNVPHTCPDDGQSGTGTSPAST